MVRRFKDSVMSKLHTKIHDIRKPLNSICMQAELIKMLSESAPENEKLQTAASKIIEHSKSCSLMLQTLYDESQ